MLTAIKVKALTIPGRYGDGNGLYLQVRESGRKSWLFRYKIGGRARAKGLGSVGDVSLAEAREKAAECRRMLRRGVDPLEVSATPTVAFADVARLYIAAHEPTWRNAKHRQQWHNTLDTYALPLLAAKSVDSIDVGDVLRVIEPIWHTKPETASRLRGRIEAILDYAAARDWRQGSNPARWRGRIQRLLPPRPKVQRVRHHAALSWQEMPGFMAELKLQRCLAASALGFTILTAARTGEVIGMRAAEVSGDVWTVPAVRMKAGREHRVPLSEQAKDLLSSEMSGEFVFPLSQMAMTMLLRRMGRATITVHGFRSTFRQWAAERTSFPREVAEAALAHVNKDRVESAYQRGDLLELRKSLMWEWAAFVCRQGV